MIGITYKCEQRKDLIIKNNPNSDWARDYATKKINHWIYFHPQ